MQTKTQEEGDQISLRAIEDRAQQRDRGETKRHRIGEVAAIDAGGERDGKT